MFSSYLCEFPLGALISFKSPKTCKLGQFAVSCQIQDDPHVWWTIQIKEWEQQAQRNSAFTVYRQVEMLCNHHAMKQT